MKKVIWIACEEFCCLYCFFFFQAEDGIRDVAVTGVQTCALPIVIDQFNQFWLTEPTNRSDGFEADPIGFEDLMEFGGQTMVFFSIALDECFRAHFLHSRPQYSRSEEHTSELQSRLHLVCRLLLE